MRRNQTLIAAMTLFGSAVGAGILGIPYVISKSGWFVGMVEIIITALLVGWITLLFGEVVLRTKGDHQLTGYVERYLGKRGKMVMLILCALEIYGAIIAYTMGSGVAVQTIIPGIPAAAGGMIFFAIMAAIIFKGLDVFERAEEYMSTIIILVVIALCAQLLGLFEVSNISTIDLSEFFSPFGVIMFAMVGIWTVPEMAQELKDKHKFKKAIIIGTALITIVYVAFATITVAALGSETPSFVTASTALSPPVLFLANIFALLAMGTSFIALGFALKEIFLHDYAMPHLNAWLLVIVPPFFITILGVTNFIQAISITGTIVTPLLLTTIVLTYFHAQHHGDRKPEYAIRGKKWAAYTLLGLFYLAAFISLIA